MRWTFRSPSSPAWVDQGGTGPVLSDPYDAGLGLHGLNHSSAVTVNLPADVPRAFLRSAPTHGRPDEGKRWLVVRVRRRVDLPGQRLVLINGSDYSFGPDGYMMTGFLKRPSGE